MQQVDRVARINLVQPAFIATVRRLGTNHVDFVTYAFVAPRRLRCRGFRLVSDATIATAAAHFWTFTARRGDGTAVSAIIRNNAADITQFLGYSAAGVVAAVIEANDVVNINADAADGSSADLSAVNLTFQLEFDPA